MIIRKLHYWAVPIIAIPFLIVIVSGLLLQVKKEISWIQPVSQNTSSHGAPQVTWDEILEELKQIEGLNIQSWEDISRVDFRPQKGLIKISTPENREIQLDASNAKVLQVALRRSDLIESFHDGSWFADFAKLWVFLPSGIIVLSLWISGVLLFFLPFYLKRTRLKNQKSSSSMDG